jgi:phosphoribosylglycinamide formyltransferase-1
MKRIAIFCSGSGTNAEVIMRRFQSHDTIKVVRLLANKPDIKALERAAQFEVPTTVFNRDTFYNTTAIEDLLQQENVDFIVLSGFLWKVPEKMVNLRPNAIINIHPSLLPKYGGKGMFGMHVHEAVIANKEVESGISIHLVNQHYDEGQLLFQAKCEVLPTDTALNLAQKVHQLEYAHFSEVIENYILNSGK